MMININEKIKALFIYEMLGKPAEHIKTALEEFVNKIGENKGISIISRKIHEPKPVEEKSAEDNKELFTTFAEAEFSIDDLNILFNIVLHTLPSHVEILEPDELKLRNFELSSVLSELALRLHRYDEIAKAAMLERNTLIGKIKELQSNQVILTTKTGQAEAKKQETEKTAKKKKEKIEKKKAKKRRKND